MTVSASGQALGEGSHRECIPGSGTVTEFCFPHTRVPEVRFLVYRRSSPDALAWLAGRLLSLPGSCLAALPRPSGSFSVLQPRSLIGFQVGSVLSSA